MSFTWNEENVRKLEEGLKRGMYLGGQAILTRSNMKVPLETAALQRSGAVSQEDEKIAVSYTSPYAVIQHENLEFNHDPGREAKYLEKAAREVAPDIPQIINQVLDL